MSELEALSQVIKPPYLLVRDQAELAWGPSSMLPEESPSEANPPGWDERDERWTIDTLLGRYDPQRREITIFTKGISFAAQKLGLPVDAIEYIVRIHEWGHAVFHLGLDNESATTMAGLAPDSRMQADMTANLTGRYLSVDTFVHEQIAQVITWLALEALRATATMEQSKRACTLLCDAFDTLTTHQPPQYRVDDLRHLDSDRLRVRFRDLARLIRSGTVRGEKKTWQTLTAWR